MNSSLFSSDDEILNSPQQTDGLERQRSISESVNDAAQKLSLLSHRKI